MAAHLPAPLRLRCRDPYCIAITERDYDNSPVMLCFEVEKGLNANTMLYRVHFAKRA